MENSKEIYYSKEHTWLKIGNEIGTVGITDFAQGQLGEIVYVDLPNVSDNFNQDEVFGSVEALKTVSDLFMPLSGEIVEINEELMDNPTFVNDKPFDEGWLVKIKISDLDELLNLLNQEDYKKLIIK